MDLEIPFPYYGGKRRAAPIIWRELGDPSGYMEPFAGSAAVLLRRPKTSGRRVETINDADGWLVNAWRAIRLSPAEVARHAASPVIEIDYHAKLAWLQERRTPDLVSWLEGDPEAHDAKAAGWWLYVTACGWGSFWDGPWRVVDGHLVKTETGSGVSRQIPLLGSQRGIVRSDLEGAKPHADQLADWFSALADRLTHVRILSGDWERCVTPSALAGKTGGDGAVAVFLDPPYATSGDLYAGTTDTAVAEQVREWCKRADPNLRIVLAGYDGEHDELLDYGWDRILGKAGQGSGFSSDPSNHRRERLWTSPACLGIHRQDALDFGDAS